MQCAAKTRYRQDDQVCVITEISSDCCKVEFTNSQRAAERSQGRAAARSRLKQALPISRAAGCESPQESGDLGSGNRGRVGGNLIEERMVRTVSNDNRISERLWGSFIRDNSN